MDTKLPGLLAALALAATAHIAAAGETHEHGHGAGEVQKLRLDAGRKWATDAPLRQAMDEINRALAEALPLIHKNRFDDAQYRALAATVNRQVAFAVDNCHLEPKADAMLHLVIADLVAGAGAMQGAIGRPPQDGAVQLAKALQAYGKYFQHPGWKAPRG